MADCDVYQDTISGMEDLVTRLRRLLEQQVVCARARSFRKMGRLAETADTLVAQISQTYDPETEAVAAQRKDVKRLYDELSLILRTEQADVRSKLEQVRRVRKVVGVYAGATRGRSDHHR